MADANGFGQGQAGRRLVPGKSVSYLHGPIQEFAAGGRHVGAENRLNLGQGCQNPLVAPPRVSAMAALAEFARLLSQGRGPIRQLLRRRGIAGACAERKDRQRQTFFELGAASAKTGAQNRRHLLPNPGSLRMMKNRPQQRP